MTNFSQDIRPFRNKKSATHGCFQDEDLILADLHTTTDDSELQIAPIRQWRDDEEAMGRLLINTGFESTDLDIQEHKWHAKSEMSAHTEAVTAAEAVLPILDDPASSPPDSTTPITAGHSSRLEPLFDDIDITPPLQNLAAAIGTDAGYSPFIVEAFVSSCPSPLAEAEAEHHRFVNDITELSRQQIDNSTGIRTAANYNTQGLIEPTSATAPPPQALIEKTDAKDSTGQNSSPKQALLSPIQIQIPAWVFALLLASQLLLVVTTISLAVTVTALKTDIVQFSTLLPTAKDNIDAQDKK